MSMMKEPLAPTTIGKIEVTKEQKKEAQSRIKEIQKKVNKRIKEISRK